MPRISDDQYFSIPVMSDLITEGCECLKCCCLVQNNDTSREVHKTFHLQLDELIDWAQHISKLFRQSTEGGENVEPSSTEL